jgi:Fusaric acid resistance protein-like
MVCGVGSPAGRLRRALATNVNAPTVWLTAVFALVGLIIAALIALATGLREVSLAAGFVAAFAEVAGSLVPPELTKQVAIPAGVAVALAPSLALLGQGRPVVAGLVAAAVFAVGALAQQDVPTGALVGALGATAYVIAVGMALVRDVPLSDSVLAGVIGLTTATVTTLAARVVRGRFVRREPASTAPKIPPLPGRTTSRLMSGIGSALRDWRRNVYVRLALRRVLVLAPLVAVLEWWRDPVALYALIVAFSVTQPTVSDTVNRALARTAGTIIAILATFALVVLFPDPVVVVVAALAMVAGLAYILRSPFITALGTTVLTVATGALAGSPTNAQNRLLSTVFGAAVGFLATVLIPVPRSPRQQVGNGTPPLA